MPYHTEDRLGHTRRGSYPRPASTLPDTYWGLGPSRAPDIESILGLPPGSIEGLTPVGPHDETPESTGRYVDGGYTHEGRFVRVRVWTRISTLFDGRPATIRSRHI